MLLDEGRWDLLLLAAAWASLLLLLRPSQRPGRGWCPQCTAPDLWIVSTETPTTRALWISAFAVLGLYALSGVPDLFAVIAVAGLAGMTGRILRPEARRCRSCGFRPPAAPGPTF